MGENADPAAVSPRKRALFATLARVCRCLRLANERYPGNGSLRSTWWYNELWLVMIGGGMIAGFFEAPSWWLFLIAATALVVIVAWVPIGTGRAERFFGEPPQERNPPIPHPFDPLTCRVRVCRFPVVLWGWKGTLTADGDVLRIVGDDPTKTLTVDPRLVKRASYSSTNGLWAMRLRNKGGKVYLQCGGGVLSSDRTDAATEISSQLAQLIRAHRGYVFGL